MKEVFGDAWALANKFDVLCITTNAQINNKNELVMGKGIALACKTRYPQIPGLLAKYVIQYGNRVFNLGKDETTGIRLVSFPTKNHWKDKSDIELIKSSAMQLVEMANANGWTKILLTRPGCGCGQLDWNYVRQVLTAIFDDRFYIISDNPIDIPMKNTVTAPPQTKQVVDKPKSNILECSTKGDIRYSAFNAHVTMFGINNTIEKHYQLCKRFGSDTPPDDWRFCKGKTPTHIVINNMKLDVRFLTQWYKLLWLTYLDNMPDLVEYAKKFDDFNDIFKGKSVNCQADVIRQYIKMGRESIVRDCSELMTYIMPGQEQMVAKEIEQPPSFDTIVKELDDITMRVSTPTIQKVQNKHKVLCVTGPRPKNLWGYNNNAKYQQLQNKLYFCIRQFYNDFDVRTCKQGGAQGVDQLFGEVCHYIRDNEYSDLQTELCMPFEGQESAWLEYGKFSKSEYRNMVKLSNNTNIINPNINNNSSKYEIIKALFKRNEVMVDTSDYVISVYAGDLNDIKLSDNKNSGTLHAMQYAYKLGKPIVNINPFTLITTRINL